PAPVASSSTSLFPSTSSFSYPSPATPEISTLSLHDALPIYVEAGNAVIHLGAHHGVAHGGVDGIGEVDGRGAGGQGDDLALGGEDRKSTRLNSSHVSISYAVFRLKKKQKMSGGVRDSTDDRV